MPCDLKPPELHRAVRIDAALSAGNRKLLGHGVDAREIGEQKSAPSAALDNDAVPLRIEHFIRGNRLRRSQYIHAVDEIGQLVLGHRAEPRVL